MINKKYHKKTILQVVPALMSGGVERGTLEIAKKIVELGARSIVISSGGRLIKDLEESGSKHIQLNVSSKNPFTMWINAKKISKIIKEEKIDIIHARSRAPAWSCFMAAKITGVKLITTFHGVYNFCNVAKKFYNSIMTKGNKVIAVSGFIRDHILKNYKTDSKKIILIHRGVNHREFDPQKINAEILQKYREKYTSPANIPLILLPARFTEWKGHIVVIEALTKIRHLKFYCVMAGDLAKHPAYVSRVKILIDKYRMQNKIQLFCNEPNMINLYGISSIVLSSSTQPEAFGRTIIEAQSMEKLVIATNIGGASETIKNEKTGFHVQPFNARELADKIQHCLAIINTEEARKIQSAARKSVIENFSLRLMLEKEMLVYEQI